MVQENWDPATSLFTNIENFSKAADCWNKTTFGLVGHKKKRILARLLGTQKGLETKPYSSFLQNLECSLREEYESICFQEELLWLQKSNSEWVCLGDKNTSYYHTKTIIRRRKNHVAALRNGEGDWVYDTATLSTMAASYFRELFTSDGPALPHLAIHGAFPEDRKSTRLNSSHSGESRMPSSA